MPTATPQEFNWKIWNKVGFGFILIAFLFFFSNTAICPDHGVLSAATGNKRVANQHTYCEYEHPLYMGGVHKFWEPCD